MIHVVTDMELLLKEVRHPRTCPEVGVIAGTLGPSQQDLRQSLLACWSQPPGTARCWLSFEGFTPVFEETCFPTAHGAASNLEPVCNLYGRDSFFKQDNCLQASLFQMGRAAMWAHLMPPAHSIGHYLCRSQ